MNPIVSVVIPAYNAAKYIEATLATLVAQTEARIEILVVDDCSRDTTAEVVQRWAAGDARIRYLRMPANSGGPAGPRNLGVAQARADWVAFCDADDLWHAGKLEAQLACAREHGAELVCAMIEPFVDGLSPKQLALPLDATLPVRQLGIWQMLMKNRVATSSVLCRRTHVLEAGGFNTARDMVAVEDYDLWLRLMSRLGVRAVRLSQALVAYRHLAGSLSASKWRQAIKIMRVHKSVFAAKGWMFLYPLLEPVLMAYYVSSWLYLRSQVDRGN